MALNNDLAGADGRLQDVAAARRNGGIRSRILFTAMELFERQSVARTHIADVMRIENLTRELFYYYFSGKEDLVNSVAELYRERCLDAVDAACDRCAGSGEAALQAAAEVAMKLFYDEDCNHSAMARVLDELGLFRKTVNEMALHAASCALGSNSDDERLREASVLLLAGIGLAEVLDVGREVALDQARGVISHVLATAA